MRSICFVLALLAGCAPDPIYTPVDISMPVAVPCKAAAVTHPDWPLQNVAPQAPLFDKVKAALVELDLRKAYEAQLEAGLKACE